MKERNKSGPELHLFNCRMNMHCMALGSYRELPLKFGWIFEYLNWPFKSSKKYKNIIEVAGFYSKV